MVRAMFLVNFMNVFGKWGMSAAFTDINLLERHSAEIMCVVLDLLNKQKAGFVV